MFTMLRRAAFVGLTGLLMAAPVGAQTVETFETVPACNNARPNMGVFGGIDYLSQWTCYNTVQPPFTPASGIARIYAVNGGANAANGTFQFLTPQQFLGAWFSGNATVQFNLFYQGNAVGTSSSLLTTATPTFLSSGYAGAVDEVTVDGGGSVQWVMDDVSYDATSVVPEPASVALVGAGLLALGAAVRRRRRA